MTVRKPFSFDPETGIRETFEYDESTDQARIITTQDVAPILDVNKELQNEGDGFKKRQFWPVARIPLALIYKWKIEEGIDVFDRNDAPALKRKLNSNEFRHLRTALHEF